MARLMSICSPANAGFIPFDINVITAAQAADLNHVVRKVRLALQNGVVQNHEHASGDVSISDIEPWP
jgi:hypothetical protein